MVDQSQQVPEELQVAAMNTREPGRLADLLGSSLPFTIEEKQKLLGEINVRARLERLGQFLSRQLAVLELSTKIQEQVGSRAHQGPARPLPPPADQGDPGGAGRGRGREPRARRALGAAQEGQAPRRGPGRGRARDRAAGGDAPQLGRVLDRPDLPRLAGDPPLEQGRAATGSTCGGPGRSSTPTTTTSRRSRNGSSNTWPCASSRRT